ncbi:MAG: type II secretion system protein M [Burkholderiaceae bacterium]|nr:type II secretion system protein M [Burkholderiaceae bacterium]
MKTIGSMKISAADWLERKIPPAWQTRWHDTRRQTQTRWQRMTRREQRMMQALAAVVAVWLTLQVAILPAWRDMVRHHQTLPTLRAQLAEVDALVQEAQALGRQRGAQVPPNAIVGELTDSWRTSAIGAAPTITAVPGTQSAWTIAFDAAQATALIDWLAYGPGVLRLTVRELTLERDRDALGKPLAGRVSGQLRLGAAETQARQ